MSLWGLHYSDMLVATTDEINLQGREVGAGTLLLCSKQLYPSTNTIVMGSLTQKLYVAHEAKDTIPAYMIKVLSLDRKSVV